MKTLMHTDYWVEIPAGEYLTGLSDCLARAGNGLVNTVEDSLRPGARQLEVMASRQPNGAASCRRLYTGSMS